MTILAMNIVPTAVFIKSENYNGWLKFSLIDKNA